MQIRKFILPVLAVGTLLAGCNQTCDKPATAAVAQTDTAYEALVRKNSSQFHKNFTAGDFDKNGPLVTEDIHVNSNGTIVVGRDKFVGRLSRYEVPFPGLAVNDRIKIVDGNTVAFHYLMQAEHKGKFGDLEPTGNKVEAMSSEFFTMDENGLMKDLITTSQVDKFLATASGEEKITEHQKVTLYPIDHSVPRAVSAKAADLYLRHFNFRDWEAMKALLSDDVEANWNSDKVSGKDAVIAKMQERLTPFSDLTYELIRHAVEGNRAAIGYTLQGTHNGVFTYKGKTYQPTGKTVETKETQFLEVTADGKIKAIITISDQAAFLKDIDAGK
ncbi:nuclear transport factor 2 family protein [Niabella ginsengisoli]|uniref:Ester cyclase n=1 Tax=Niabella ginsengisoli TaxID=522298 RepID=A0ABS9SKM7_9BACT|nr:nuclear transport factor 2 family protein [Niabella ginsengisoli]MCH5598895.1 ester cyclase [Niabella ginsengisoli]